MVVIHLESNDLEIFQYLLGTFLIIPEIRIFGFLFQFFDFLDKPWQVKVNPPILSV
jgi:hypothetical protein